MKNRFDLLALFNHCAYDGFLEEIRSPELVRTLDGFMEEIRSPELVRTFLNTEKEKSQGTYFQYLKGKSVMGLTLVQPIALFQTLKRKSTMGPRGVGQKIKDF